MSNRIAILLQKARRKTLAEIVDIVLERGRNRVMLTAYRLRYRRTEFGTGVVIRGKLIIRGGGQVKIGNQVQIHGQLTIDAIGQIIIGNRSGFYRDRQRDNIISTRNPSARVVIGDNCAFNGSEIVACTLVEFQRCCIVSDALIEDTDHHSVEINRWDPAAVGKSYPISIGENVWIGSRAAILKGVTIGNNSVIGLATVVRKPVPANCVVIGNPQQVVKELNTNVSPYEATSWTHSLPLAN